MSRRIKPEWLKYSKNKRKVLPGLLGFLRKERRSIESRYGFECKNPAVETPRAQAEVKSKEAEKKWNLGLKDEAEVLSEEALVLALQSHLQVHRTIAGTLIIEARAKIEEKELEHDGKVRLHERAREYYSEATQIMQQLKAPLDSEVLRQVDLALDLFEKAAKLAEEVFNCE